jgi:hypothetical protein
MQACVHGNSAPGKKCMIDFPTLTEAGHAADVQQDRPPMHADRWRVPVVVAALKTQLAASHYPNKTLHGPSEGRRK